MEAGRESDRRPAARKQREIARAHDEETRAAVRLGTHREQHAIVLVAAAGAWDEERLAWQHARHVKMAVGAGAADIGLDDPIGDGGGACGANRVDVAIGRVAACGWRDGWQVGEGAGVGDIIERLKRGRSAVGGQRHALEARSGQVGHEGVVCESIQSERRDNVWAVESAEVDGDAAIGRVEGIGDMEEEEGRLRTGNDCTRPMIAAGQ